MVKIAKTKKLKCFKKKLSRKNIEMYAGGPKFAQEIFFWSYHLRVCSSSFRKYFVVKEHWYLQLYSSVKWFNPTYLFLPRDASEI